LGFLFEASQRPPGELSRPAFGMNCRRVPVPFIVVRIMI
jgi:hypothetical protein